MCIDGCGVIATGSANTLFRGSKKAGGVAANKVLYAPSDGRCVVERDRGREAGDGTAREQEQARKREGGRHRRLTFGRPLMHGDKKSLSDKGSVSQI